ncbi:hypothetical protein BDV38DRAFT_265793 [Aspergillus pseudotamarii]|uniref:Uncharacterized protein n=1 Tax=Aspergillus pseudotamarii TaxID=132259 RepID=A0A5N6SAI0_ASPPS|nr:uncharacterized protein BDV38DRAFT_265793 [Aspergillus pseudotamarii]KAE8130977.1 hypothetical protein BDV38DRAFT_265793 [Aspergillus pseudotamarii]
MLEIKMMFLFSFIYTSFSFYSMTTMITAATNSTWNGNKKSRGGQRQERGLEYEQAMLL